MMPCVKQHQERSGNFVLFFSCQRPRSVHTDERALRVLRDLGYRAPREHASVVDVSAQRTTLALSGPGVRDLLAGGCAIDLHPRVFGPGDCVQTELAHAPVVLLRRDPGFWVFVRASFAAHLVDWLVDASVEYTG